MEVTVMPVFETSEQTDKLDVALAKAQGEIRPAIKDATNPAFRSKYADLPAVWEACREVLAKHGISVTQWPVHGEDGRLHIVTRVALAGQWIRAHFSIPVSKQDPQGFGSAVTYAKRYTLSAALGVVADEDDDGNAASQPQRSQSRTAHANGKTSDQPLPPAKPVLSKEYGTFAEWLAKQVPDPWPTRGELWGEVLLLAGAEWNAETLKTCTDGKVFEDIKQKILSRSKVAALAN